MTDAVKIYHNPRCSKSRETLNLLKSNDIDPEVVLYLETPPGRADDPPVAEDAEHGQRTRADASERRSV